MKVYILGESTLGEKCYKNIRNYCNIIGFIDNDSKKKEKYTNGGIEIFSPQILKDNSDYDLIIIASMYVEEIVFQLRKNNIFNFILPPMDGKDISHKDFNVYVEYSKKACEFYYDRVKHLQQKVKKLSISEYNQRYLSGKPIIEIFRYVEFMWSTYKYSGSPNVFLDYGGGSGLLGAFVKYLGVENVYYHDIYNVLCEDAKIIANEINIEFNDYICGDLDDVIKYSILNNVYFDAVSSYDVLEHIYDVEDFLERLPQICKRDCFIGMWTTANSYNARIVKDIEAKHYQKEYLGSKNLVGWKERDALLSYIQIREQIIMELVNRQGISISEFDLIRLVRETRGMDKKDMYTHLNKFSIEGIHPKIRKDKFPSNTCDPLTGNWAEHLIDFDELAKSVKSFANVYIFPEEREEFDIIGFCLHNKAYSHILEEFIDEQDKQLFRHNAYYSMMSRWIKKLNTDKNIADWLVSKEIHEVIIYGAGELGLILYEQLIKDNRIVIKALCDKNKRTNSFSQFVRNIEMIDIDDLNSNIAEEKNIIVTPVHVYDEIHKSITRKIKHNVINLNTIIDEM